MEQHKHCYFCGTVLESNGDCSLCDSCEIAQRYFPNGCDDCPDKQQCFMEQEDKFIEEQEEKQYRAEDSLYEA